MSCMLCLCVFVCVCVCVVVCAYACVHTYMEATRVCTDARTHNQTFVTYIHAPPTYQNACKRTANENAYMHTRIRTCRRACINTQVWTLAMWVRGAYLRVQRVFPFVTLVNIRNVVFLRYFVQKFVLPHYGGTYTGTAAAVCAKVEQAVRIVAGGQSAEALRVVAARWAASLQQLGATCSHMLRTHIGVCMYMYVCVYAVCVCTYTHIFACIHGHRYVHAYLIVHIHRCA